MFSNHNRIKEEINIYKISKNLLRVLGGGGKRGPERYEKTSYFSWTERWTER